MPELLLLTKTEASISEGGHKIHRNKIVLYWRRD